jgi:hypothetical protein
MGRLVKAEVDKKWGQGVDLGTAGMAVLTSVWRTKVDTALRLGQRPPSAVPVLCSVACIMPPTIPVDVIKHIIEHVSDDKETLGSCALTHHTWLPYARTEQFRTITYEVRNKSIEQRLTEPVLSKIGPFVSNICIQTPRDSAPRLEELNMSTLYGHLCWLAPFLPSRPRKILIAGLHLIFDEQMAKSDYALTEDRRVILDLLEGITELELTFMSFVRPIASTPLEVLLSTFPTLGSLTCNYIGLDVTEVQKQSDITRALAQHSLKYLRWHNVNPLSNMLLSVLHRSPNVAHICYLSISCDRSPLISLETVLPMALSLQKLELHVLPPSDLCKHYSFG